MCECNCKSNIESKEVIDYHINEENGTVAAVLTVPQDMMAEEMVNIMNKASGSLFVTTDISFTESILLDGTYRGVAYCHPDDKFNENEGKKIAKQKALKAYYHDRKRVAVRVQKIFEDMARRMAAAAEHNKFAIEHIQEMLDN